MQLNSDSTEKDSLISEDKDQRLKISSIAAIVTTVSNSQINHSCASISYCCHIIFGLVYFLAEPISFAMSFSTSLSLKFEIFTVFVNKSSSLDLTPKSQNGN